MAKQKLKHMPSWTSGTNKIYTYTVYIYIYISYILFSSFHDSLEVLIKKIRLIWVMKGCVSSPFTGFQSFSGRPSAQHQLVLRVDAVGCHLQSLLDHSKGDLWEQWKANCCVPFIHDIWFFVFNRVHKYF